MKKQLTPLFLYQILYQNLGPQHWWPARTRLEVILGAILTQNTAWSNVEKAITELRKKKLLNLKKLEKVSPAELEKTIRSSGFYKQKAGRIINFVNYLKNNYQSNLNKFLNQPLNKLRAELLVLNGIGPETADSILLYAGNKPSFVIDAYTKRIVQRLGWKVGNGYDELKTYFEKNLSREVQIYNEYHALLVRLAKDYCQKTPRCPACPLKEYCELK